MQPARLIMLNLSCLSGINGRSFRCRGLAQLLAGARTRYLKEFNGPPWVHARHGVLEAVHHSRSKAVTTKSKTAQLSSARTASADTAGTAATQSCPRALTSQSRMSSEILIPSVALDTSAQPMWAYMSAHTGPEHLLINHKP